MVGFVSPLNGIGARTSYGKVQRCVVPRMSESHAVSSAAAVAKRAHVLERIEQYAGADRGIFGLESELREQILATIEQLEAEKVGVETISTPELQGTWRLLYTTLTILGRRRTKLSLASSTKKGFVNLGDFLQVVDSDSAVNRIEFSALGDMIHGKFEILCGYNQISSQRVEVTTKSWSLEPMKLTEMLGEENVKLLFRIFNPEGWLDVTYVDDALRIGRDDKGLIYVLERVDEK